MTELKFLDSIEEYDSRKSYLDFNLTPEDMRTYPSSSFVRLFDPASLEALALTAIETSRQIQEKKNEIPSLIAHPSDELFGYWLELRVGLLVGSIFMNRSITFSPRSGEPAYGTKMEPHQVEGIKNTMELYLAVLRKIGYKIFPETQLRLDEARNKATPNP